MVNHSWPGNILELKSSIEKAVLCRQGNIITVEDLPRQVLNPLTPGPSQQPVAIKSLEAVEKQAIAQAWDYYDGCINQMTAALQIGRTTLWRKLKKYQIAKR